MRRSDFANTEDHIYPRGRNELTVSLSAARGDVDSVTLVWWPRYETERSSCRIPVKRELRDAYLDHYRAVIQTDGISAYTRYALLFQSGGETVRLGKNGFSAPDDKENFFEFLWPNPTDAYRAPDWASEQVYYRCSRTLRNGEASNDPPGAEPWGAPPTRENFQGGDLRGIIEKLGYIRGSRRNVPVSHAHIQSAVQPQVRHCGLFRHRSRLRQRRTISRSLSAAPASFGLRVLLDGVFNHCGYYWPPFQDVVRNGESSGYASWFFPQSFPVNEKLENYDCVGHYKWMPRDSIWRTPERRDYFITVGKYWIRNFHIDGWRLDVADEAPTQFWEHFSGRDQKGKPGSAPARRSVGGCAPAARPRPARQRDELSLPGRRRDWLAKDRISPAELDHRLNRMLSLYPWETALRLYNPLDSHDTERFRWLCRDKRRHALAAALQMTFPGCPAVFYGDEVGLSSGNDPDCRLAMEWDEEKQIKASRPLQETHRHTAGVTVPPPRGLPRVPLRRCLQRVCLSPDVRRGRKPCRPQRRERAGENENRRRGDVDAPHQRQKTCILGKRRDHRRSCAVLRGNISEESEGTKMKKSTMKMLALLLLAAMMLAAFTACGSNEAPSTSPVPPTETTEKPAAGSAETEPVTINFWHHYSAQSAENETLMQCSHPPI